MDVLKAYHEFVNNVANALNTQGVKPVEEKGEMCCALLVVVHPGNPQKGGPIGGSLNWKDGKWEPAAQIEEPEPYRGDN